MLEILFVFIIQAFKKFIGKHMIFYVNNILFGKHRERERDISYCWFTLPKGHKSLDWVR